MLPLRRDGTSSSTGCRLNGFFLQLFLFQSGGNQEETALQLLWALCCRLQPKTPSLSHSYPSRPRVSSNFHCSIREKSPTSSEATDIAKPGSNDEDSQGMALHHCDRILGTEQPLGTHYSRAYCRFLRKRCQLRDCTCARAGHPCD